MSLTVEVYVGSTFTDGKRKLVARGVLHNVSDLNDISDYVGTLEEYGAPSLGIDPMFIENIEIKGHTRRQSVWKLVKKLAGQVA